MSRELVCSPNFNYYMEYFLLRWLTVFIFLFLLVFGGFIFVQTLISDYLLQLILSGSLILYALFTSIPIISFFIIFLVGMIKLYRDYKRAFNSEIDSLYITCGQLSTLLWILDNIALGKVSELSKIRQFDLDELSEALEAVKILDAEIKNGLDALFQALNLNISTLREMRKIKRKLKYAEKIFGIAILGSFAIAMAIPYIIGVKTLINILFSNSAFYLLILLGLPWIMILAILIVYLPYTYVVTLRAKRLLNSGLFSFPETSLLAENIIERLLAIIATRISDPVVLFFNRRYKYLKPIKNIGRGIGVYILEPMSISPPSIGEYIELFEKRLAKPI